MNIEIPPNIKEQLVEAKMPLNKDGLLMLWTAHKNLLARYKESEMELRVLCAKSLVADKPKEGINNVDLGNGYTAKVGINFNYNLDKPNDVIESQLAAIAKIGNEGAFIADRIITWTPNFHISEYRKLQDDVDAGSATAKQILNMVNEILEITDAAPTLAIKEPKGKK